MVPMWGLNIARGINFDLKKKKHIIVKTAKNK